MGDARSPVGASASISPWRDLWSLTTQGRGEGGRAAAGALRGAHAPRACTLALSRQLLTWRVDGQLKSMLRPPQFPRFGRTQPVPRVEDEVQEPNTPPLLLLSLGANVLLLLLLLLVNLKRRRAATPGRATTTAEAAKLEAELATAKQKRKSGANDRPPIKSLKHAVEELRGLQVAYRYIEAGELLDQLRSELARTDVHGGREIAEATRSLQSLLAGGAFEERISISRGAISDLNSDDGFTLVSSDASMRVLQRMTSERLLSVKIEGILKGVRPSDCMLIWREVELYPDWFPYVTRGTLLYDGHP